VLKLCIVYEAAADCELGCSLADRVVVECIEWIRDQPELLAHQREWTTEDRGIQFRWDAIDDLGRNMDLRVRGGYEDGEQDYPDFKAAVRALRVIRNLFDDVDAVVLIRDTDDQPDRINGLNQAKNRFDGKPPGFRVLVGAARTKRECWVLSGFIPNDDIETGLLESERQYLGFDPTARSQELTAKNNENEDKRSAKRVLRKLTQGSSDREEECWTETPLEQLRSKGESNGLAEYLDQIEDVLVPLIQGRHRN
jgi:hypothetical protein